MAGISSKILGIHNILKSQQQSFPHVTGLTSIFNGTLTVQVRHRRPGHPINLTRPRFPLWFLRKELVNVDQSLTEPNKQFIEEVVHEKFGPPAIISGLSTYQLKSPLKIEAEPRGEWHKKTRRTGLIGRKIGQQPMWDKNGNRFTTTLIQIVDNHVVKYIPPEEVKDKREIRYRESSRYGLLMVGAESADPQNYTREYCGLFAKAGLMPKKQLCRFFISPEAAIQAGTPLYANHFSVGDVVDIRGKTIDRGFQGVMKRWGFHGMPATHGQTKTHRKGGNTGGGGEKARIWPGTKLPGHMGNRWRVLRGMQVMRINTKYNILYVRGVGVPGPVNGYVYIFDTVLPLRKRKEKPAAFPTFYPEDLEEPLPEDLFHESLHMFSDPSIKHQPEKK
ncbi:39S ribosomal protein L3, mitochondrial [Macrosteles quadrilineatus]|uniref:39S ribosomal protein L3, mitochondrial n=1 Tax=Macrosteles quadrilineatus TaxID=74068 RepID=UPI0023E20A9B|nr:39S ribosomal protein L3, mitochondrial [Macrosteles quadrilineatus]